VSARNRPPGVAVMFGRALLLRCPRCGQRRLFHRWLIMVKRCPCCEYVYEREEGFALGASVINLIFGQFVAVAFLVVSLMLTWPDPPVALLAALGVGLAIAAGVFFLPFSKTIWAALDLTMRATMGSSYGASNQQPGRSDGDQTTADGPRAGTETSAVRPTDSV